MPPDESIEQFKPTSLTSIQRSRLNGMALRLLGFSFWGIEPCNGGFQLLGNRTQQIQFSKLSAPLTIGKVIGFTAIIVPLKRGEKFKIAGLQSTEAKRFVEGANAAFREYFTTQYRAVEDEIQILLQVIDRLERPRRYPSACLLHPFVERANHLIEMLPRQFPEGVLSEKQQRHFDKICGFQKEAPKLRAKAINDFTQRELIEKRHFFDTIESHPLTPEQRLAVVTDEDATLVLAGAGSGKTSVTVAKAAYLIEQEIREPDSILLLAFGSDAAREMAERLAAKTGISVEALTFHSLGNKIIREVEGSAPPLAAHASDEAKFRSLLRDILIHDVAKREGLGHVLQKWFSEFYKPYKNEWDFKTQSEYFEWVKANDLRTLNGDRVKSFEEWEISNWLYCNGIRFEYEPIFEHPLPKDARGAYRPDFRLIESGVYIEHFGVRKTRGKDGSARWTTAPYVDRERYLADMSWKQKLHRDSGTTLIETFSYEKEEGQLLSRLEEKLASHADLEPIVEERYFDILVKMGQIDTFTQMISTFLRHFKSVGASISSCQARVEGGRDAARNRAFLKIFEPLYEAYQVRLGEQIDFEDMINRATMHITAGRYQSPYRHLLVDEFQDISEGRARLLQALKAQHTDARIFAVGDDWQSIFRFAGADIHIMRNFGDGFGGRLGEQKNVQETVDLGRTFRSVDKIAIPARNFVLKNPSQIKKQVIAPQSTDSSAIHLVFYDRGQDQTALRSTLHSLAQRTENGRSILLLGRYKFGKPDHFHALAAAFPTLSIRFMTIHRSKGLEADHVIILKADSDTMGFPSEVVDDPLLNLVLPKPETYAHAEERRLFYVALTRARKSVTILADRTRPSAFVRELVDQPDEFGITEMGESGASNPQCAACGGRMLARSGKKKGRYFSCEHWPLCRETLFPCSKCKQRLPITNQADPKHKVCTCGASYPSCPECSNGWLVERRGRFGKFWGCVRYPNCKGRMKWSSPSEAKRTKTS